MKKIFLLILVAIVTISCSKEEDPTPPIPSPVVELVPEIELTIAPTDAIIPYSTNVTVTWTTKNAKKVSINGEAMTSPNGSKIYSSLIATTKFTALATNVLKTATAEKTITVAEELSPTIELTVTPDYVVYGVNSIIINWVILNSKTATLNGENISLTGSKVLSNLTESKEFQIIAKNFVKTATVTKTATVGDWTTSDFGIIAHDTWRLIRYTIWVGDVLYNDTPFTDSEIARVWYFYTNYTYDIFNSDGTRWASGPLPNWGLDLDGKHFIRGDNSYLIEKLDQNELIVSRSIIITYQGQDLNAIERYNFAR